ncbi:MAG: TonB-dependent receptor [Marinilabiliales bacterium]|nr:MAG: TonB-dependent receptor [Marinilabiliales bacterium]
MIRRITLILFICTALAGAAGGQSGVIRGRVADSRTGEPLPQGTVLYGRGYGTVTGDNGYYEFIHEHGNITITFRYVGYRPVVRHVTLQPGDTLEIDAALEYDAPEIDQVVVSAGKSEQRVSELTVSLSIIRPEVLSASHISDASGMLERTSGIEVLDGQASVRGGSGFSYGAGSRVLALIDGLPVLSADAGSIKWHFLPFENISQVEIIKGASSVLYGSSALNGIINFRTARPGSEPVTRFFIETGVYGRPARREWVWWDSPRTFAGTSFSHLQRTGNTDMGVALYLNEDSGYRRLNDNRLGRGNIMVRHDHSRVEGFSFGVNVNGGLTRKSDFILWEDARSGALKQDESTANRLYGSLVTIDPWISLNREGHSKHDLRTRLQSSINDFPEAPRNNSHARSFLAEYQFARSFSPVFTLNSGIMQNYSRIESLFYGDHNSLNIAAYTQADISPADRLKIVAGLRGEINSLDGEYDRFVPLFRTGVNYRLADYTFLRGSWGQGYRYPSIAEKHAATTLGSVRIVPNPDVGPETGWSTEVGVMQGIMTGVLNGQADLAFFYLRNSGMIEYLFGIYPDYEEGGFSYGFKAVNVEESRVYGGEAGFSLWFDTGRSRYYINGGYVFIHPVEYDPGTGKNKEGFLKYRRRHSANLNISGEYGRLEAGFAIRAGSRILSIDDVFLDELTRESILPGFYDYWNNSYGGHMVVDFNSGYPLSDLLKLSLAVKNLFNTEHMGRPGDIMPQRNFSLRLSGTF